jgi:hypothetical protein
MLTLSRNAILVAVTICSIATSSLNAQTNYATRSALSKTELSEGFTLNVSRPISAKPKWLRIVLPFKAEDATTDKALEKISMHMKSVQKALTDLGAVASSLEFAEIETSTSSANPYSNPQVQIGMPVNGFPNAFQAVQIAPALPVQAFQALPATRLAPVMQRGDGTKTLPTFVIATSAVSASWSIEGKSNIEIAAMKPKLLADIAKQNLDGKELVHKFTPEQEDEIFEMTKIDIQNLIQTILIHLEKLEIQILILVRFDIIDLPNET